MKKTFVLMILLIGLVSQTVSGYGPWQAEETSISAKLDELEAAIQRAEESKAAHPAFLADLKAILADLRQISETEEPNATWGEYQGGGQQSIIASYFHGQSTDGWKLDFGTLTNSGANGFGGGNNNGFLLADCPADSITGYYIAPPEFHGGWTDFSELRIKIWSRSGKYYYSDWGFRGDIYLANGTKTASLTLPRRPNTEWDSFVIKLDSSEKWVLGGGAKSLNEVLGNVTNFQIRAEYGEGRVTAGLDNVELIP